MRGDREGRAAHPSRGRVELIKNSGRLGPYSRTMPRAPWQSLGGWHFFMSEAAGLPRRASARHAGRLSTPSETSTKVYQIEDVAYHFQTAEVRFRTPLHENGVNLRFIFDSLVGVPRRASAHRVGRLRPLASKHHICKTVKTM